MTQQKRPSPSTPLESHLNILTTQQFLCVCLKRTHLLTRWYWQVATMTSAIRSILHCPMSKQIYQKHPRRRHVRELWFILRNRILSCIMRKKKSFLGNVVNREVFCKFISDNTTSHHIPSDWFFLWSEHYFHFVTEKEERWVSLQSGSLKHSTRVHS